MRNNPFGNVCMVVIICLLTVIAMKLDTVPVNAARSWNYEVIHVLDGQAADEIQKHAQSGWELVAAPFWSNANALSGSAGLLIFRK